MERIFEDTVMGERAAHESHPLYMSGLPGLIAATRQYITEENGDSDKVVEA